MTPTTKRRATPPVQPTIATTEVATTTSTSRKPWKKKTPTEVVLDQINRVREDVEQKEEELKHAKRQLEKLEEAAKLLEQL
jgi:uncharacterized protein YoxC